MGLALVHFSEQKRNFFLRNQCVFMFSGRRGWGTRVINSGIPPNLHFSENDSYHCFASSNNIDFTE